MLDEAVFGEWLGALLAFYFLFIVAFVAPLWAVVYSVYCLRQRSNPPSTSSHFVRLTEYFFGFANPLLYVGFILLALLKPLTTLDRVFWHVSLLILLTVWLVRLTGSWLHNSSQQLRIARISSVAGACAVTAHLVLGIAYWTRIFVVNSRTPVNLIYLGPWTLYLLLYLVPLHLLWRHYRALSFGQTETFLLPPTSATRVAAAGILAFLSLAVISSGLTKSDAEARKFVESHAKVITEAADASGLKASTLAAVLYTIQTDTSIWEPALNRLLGHAWLTDDKSHLLLSDSLDFSMGSAQIKPTTAQTAVAMVELSRTDGKYLELTHSKQFRDIPSIESLPKLPREKALGLKMPLDRNSTKSDVLTVLLNDDHAIAMAAAILALTAIQWEEKNPSWSIRERTDILATIYQLGFTKSQPKPNPVANDFGNRAKNLAEAMWFTALFND